MGIQPTKTVTISYEEHQQIVQEYEGRLRNRSNSKDYWQSLAISLRNENLRLDAALTAQRQADEEVRMDRQRIEEERDDIQRVAKRLGSGELAVMRQEKNRLEECVASYQNALDVAKERIQSQKTAISILQSIEDTLKAKLSKDLVNGKG